MPQKNIPLCSILLCSLIFFVSSYVAYVEHGSIFSQIKTAELEEYGGITFHHLKNLEFWRLLASQFIHIKPIYTLFNVATLLLIGLFIEPYIGFTRFFLLWFIAGTSDTLFNIMLGSSSYGLSTTGALHAVIGIAACGIVLSVKRIDIPKKLTAALLFSILPAFILDLAYGHHLKTGHMFSFMIGTGIGFLYLKSYKGSVYKNALPKYAHPGQTGKSLS